MSDRQNWERPRTWPLFGIGHNGGPPLDDEPPGKKLFLKHSWKAAHDAVWKNVPRDIMLFRLRRAKAAGLSYRDYMLKLLDTGRHPQADDGETPSIPRPTSDKDLAS